MRGYAETHGRYDPFWCVKDAVFGDAQAHPVGEVLSTLADLIDPTCEMVPATRHPYGDYANCRCSACGYDGAFEPLVRPVDGYPVPDERMWRYCPHCGCRVTGGERDG